VLPPDGEPLHDLRDHLDRFGPPPYRGSPGQLIRGIHAAGLTGRGGADFPTAAKMSAVLSSRRSAVAVANGAEGELASQKDKLLLWYSPHLVLDGLQLAAEAVGADRAYVYVTRLRYLTDRLHAAVAARRSAGIDRLPAHVVHGPQRFLAGEESALVSRLEGGPALPRFKSPRVFERGVDGAPTLVQNVETLAHLALIARYGPAWFRSVGTPEEPGTRLVTRLAPDGGAAVAEAALGTPLRDLLTLDAERVQAVLIGGYHGAWIPIGRATNLELSAASVAPTGAALGAGVLAELPTDRCGLVETARVVRYLALESAGQCGPCLNGLAAIANALQKMSGFGFDPRTRTHLERWAGLTAGRGACKHPDGTVRLVRSALRVFTGEITLHRAGRCSATSRAPFLPAHMDGPIDESDWR
jgi:NADH:ubiquinone oxidoreductase subunit F (NADH-binding)